ncbi:hypothetical protein [Mumia sp. DW29H23]|uniref:hypothetical protein n=1 Tax=Mumia sp. DW29H23 TaxID=3421241 RepID=UPI003D692C2D
MLIVAAGVLALAAVVLAADNPDVPADPSWDGTASYTCLAPYDAVLLNERDTPGGEQPPDYDELVRTCRQAQVERFTLAVGAALAAALLVGAAWAVDRRRPRSDAK